MEDFELIEKYFLNELSNDQLAHFNERLRNDVAFKKQFEIETVILKSLQYSQEKERMKAIHLFKTEVQVSRNPWYNQEAFFIAGVSALAVWLFSTVSSSLINLDPENYKWMGLVVAMLFAFSGAIYLRKEFDFRLVPVAFINGVLIFVTASGIDAINQGIEVKNDQDKATFIPFTQKGTWWPTQSLVDSLVHEKNTRQKLTEENARLNQAFTVMQDSCFNATFDKFVPMVVPNSSTIAAGGKYEAHVFLAASNSRQKIEFFANGLQVSEIMDPYSKVKMGKIEFTVSGAEYDPKTLLEKKTYKVQIKLPDTTLTQVVEYFVAQPIIKVTTGTAPTLYMNCGNMVNIEVPALGTNYNPNFSASGASIIKGGTPGRVTIIPTERKINVNVSNAGTDLGSVAFDVKPIPLPRYIIRDNAGNEIDKKAGVLGSSLNGLRVVPESDPSFANEVPKDAVYRIRSMDVIHARGTSPVNRMNATSEVLDLSAWRPQFKPGDRIVIEIKTVTRVTYNGEEQKVEVRNEVHNVDIK